MQKNMAVLIPMSASFYSATDVVFTGDSFIYGGEFPKLSSLQPISPVMLSRERVT